MGIDIRVDASWFMLLGLLLWSFSAVVFPSNVPGLTGAAYALMGLAGTLMFILSLLAHELSHAVVARSKGIPVAGITLFVFGGMAHMLGEAETPGDEFQIAFVGPVASLAAAALLGGAAWLSWRLGMSPGVVSVMQYISGLNIVLAVFNMLPGYPLDGGRVFRSAVWKLTGDVARATRWAAACGRWLAYGLIALGLWMTLGGNPVGGLWLAFIGWFLRNAAATVPRGDATHEA